MPIKRIRVYEFDARTFIGEFHFTDSQLIPNIVQHGAMFFKLEDKGYIRIAQPVYVPTIWNQP